MDDGGRCIMSKMEPAKGIAKAGDTGCRGSHSLVFLVQTCVFLGQEPNLAPGILKSEKTIIENQELSLASENW